MLYDTTTVALLPRIAARPGTGAGTGWPASGAVYVWLTSTLMFSGNDTTFSRNVRVWSKPRAPTRPRTESSAVSVGDNGPTFTTGLPCGLNAATLNARMMAGLLASLTARAIGVDGSATMP